MAKKQNIRNLDFVNRVNDLYAKGYTDKQISAKLEKELGYKVHPITVFRARHLGQIKRE
jgi:hypothetical protein